MADALCAQVDNDVFFPEGQGASVRVAKLVCRRCDVQQDCLDYAVKHKIVHGVWGGMADRERRAYRRAS